MIISASRRTDIPAFYAPWLMNRLRAGEVYVRNPMNAHQVSRVSLKQEDVDSIVFWTKDASPLLPFLPEIEEMGHKYLFQYTLTPYGADLEPHVDKRRSFEAFSTLAARLGPDGVVWRCDPILLTESWTTERFLRAFEMLAGRLEGMSGRCVVSFVDEYAHMRRTAPEIRIPSEAQMRKMAVEVARIARKRGMTPSACAEKLDFSQEGIEPRACIDRADVERLLGRAIAIRPDKNQRPACRCLRSVDIGAYNTCPHGCAYCYARRSARLTPVRQDAPIMGSALTGSERILERAERPDSSRRT